MELARNCVKWLEFVLVLVNNGILVTQLISAVKNPYSKVLPFVLLLIHPTCHPSLSAQPPPLALSESSVYRRTTQFDGG
jgi:hypothetical protein